MVHVFKSGRMMFKHKNKFFHFQKHYLFIIFKFFFIFFWGVKLADTLRSQLCLWSLWPVRTPSCPTECAWQAGSGVARLRARAGQPCPWLPGWPGQEAQAQESTRGDAVACGWCGVSWPGNPVDPFFFFRFHFYKGKGSLSVEQPVLHDSLCCIVLVLFCKLYNF